MKIITKLLIIVVILSTFIVPALAQNEADKHIDDFKNILPDEYLELDFSTEVMLTLVSPKALLSELWGAVSGSGGEVASFFLLLLGVLALLALASSAPGQVSSAVGCGVASVSAVLILTRLGRIYTEIVSSLDEMNSFFSSLIPVLSAITIAGGGSATASTQAAGMNLTVSLLSGVVFALLSSIVGFGFAMAFLSIFDNEAVANMSKGVRNFFLWFMGIITAVVMATISLQSVLASSADNAAMRAAKYMASGSIPVVGGVISGSLSTLAAGLSYAKGIVGTGAVWVAVGILLIPLVMALLYRLCLSVCSSFADFLGISSAQRLLNAFRFSLDSIIAFYSLSSLIYIFEIILFMKSGVAIA